MNRNAESGESPAASLPSAGIDGASDQTISGPPVRAESCSPATRRKRSAVGDPRETARTRRVLGSRVVIRSTVPATSMRSNTPVAFRFASARRSTSQVSPLNTTGRSAMMSRPGPESASNARVSMMMSRSKRSPPIFTRRAWSSRPMTSAWLLSPSPRTVARYSERILASGNESSSTSRIAFSCMRVLCAERSKDPMMRMLGAPRSRPVAGPASPGGAAEGVETWAALAWASTSAASIASNATSRGPRNPSFATDALRDAERPRRVPASVPCRAFPVSPARAVARPFGAL